MKILNLLIFLFTIQLLFASKTIPLLNQHPHSKKWSLSREAKEKLTQWNIKEKPFHVIAVGGPTRVGKSFVFNNMLDQFKENGKLHFGHFHHDDTSISVTTGVDIALVEYHGKLIMLLDCEGLDSVSKKMDERLMLILCMISQKMIYMTRQLRETDNDNIAVMLANLNKLNSNDNRSRNDVQIPLNTLYFLNNRSKLPIEDRNPNFIETYVTVRKDAKDLVKRFPNRKVFYIMEKDFRPKLQVEEEDEEDNDDLFFVDSDEEDEDEEKQEVGDGKKEEQNEKKVNVIKNEPVKVPEGPTPFESDIAALFHDLSYNSKPFNLGSKALSIDEFVNYLENQVLYAINTNDEIAFPNVVGAMYKSYAENCRRQVSNNMPSPPTYYNSNRAHIRQSLTEIQNIKQRYHRCIQNYKEFVVDVTNEFENDLDVLGRNIDYEHGRLGRRVDYTRTERRENGKRTFNRGCVSSRCGSKTYEYERVTYYIKRNIDVLYNGQQDYGNWFNDGSTSYFYTN